MGINFCLSLKIVLNSDDRYWRLECIWLLDTVQLFRPWKQIRFPILHWFFFMQYLLFIIAATPKHSFIKRMMLLKGGECDLTELMWTLNVFVSEFYPEGYLRDSSRECAVAFWAPWCRVWARWPYIFIECLLCAMQCGHNAQQESHGPFSAYSLTEKSDIKQVRDMCWILQKKSTLQRNLIQFGGRSH